jgi:hypothetical protein
MKELIVQFPSRDYSLAHRLIQNAPKDVVFFTELIKFILRACYISQDLWFHLFVHLVELADEDPKKFRRSLLVHWIEQDSVFCCNFLQETYDGLRWWTSNQRKDAIENMLERVVRKEYALATTKLKLI